MSFRVRYVPEVEEVLYFNIKKTYFLLEFDSSDNIVTSKNQFVHLLSEPDVVGKDSVHSRDKLRSVLEGESFGHFRKKSGVLRGSKKSFEILSSGVELGAFIGTGRTSSGRDWR